MGKQDGGSRDWCEAQWGRGLGLESRPTWHKYWLEGRNDPLLRRAAILLLQRGSERTSAHWIKKAISSSKIPRKNQVLFLVPNPDKITVRIKKLLPCSLRRKIRFFRINENNNWTLTFSFIYNTKQHPKSFLTNWLIAVKWYSVQCNYVNNIFQTICIN